LDDAKLIKEVRNYTKQRKIEELRSFSCTQKDIDTYLNGHQYISDAYWGLLNVCLTKNSQNFETQSYIYRIMAKQLVKEGKNPEHAIEQACSSQLIGYELHALPMQAMIVTINDNKCKLCDHLNGKVMEIRDAQKLKLIPHKPCDNVCCNAFYTAKVKRDKDGFVQIKD